MPDVTLVTKLGRWASFSARHEGGPSEQLELADIFPRKEEAILIRDGEGFSYRRECLLECAPDIHIELTEAEGDPSIQVLAEIRGRLTDPWFGCLDAGALEAYGVRRVVIRASGTQEDTPALFDQLRDVLAKLEWDWVLPHLTAHPTLPAMI